MHVEEHDRDGGEAESNAWCHVLTRRSSLGRSDSTSQPVNQPASQSVSQSVSQPISQSVSQSVSQPASQSVS
ncbi:hypothetical protein E2C01_045821 [Portunus trituberculatus]|uniref:Uncharacterized protein n=1 Tax=Portunus trituberculatus TaxID=210409 RepID=A0A5B7G411_PORTR|nr:hypothetical protein [Portunus trituberculatus]